MTAITADIVMSVRASLDSAGESTDLTLASAGIKVTLGRANSPFLSHQTVEYEDFTSEKMLGGAAFKATNDGHRLIVSYLDWLSEEEAIKELAPSYKEEVVGAIVPRVFAEKLLSRAHRHLRFRFVSNLDLINVWTIRKKLDYFDEDGKPVFVGEEPVEVSAESSEE